VIGNQNGRDLGIQISGDFLKYKNRYLFDYKLGLFNGSGINVNDNNNNKDIAGRLIAHPVTGLNLGGSFYSGTGFYGTPTGANHGRNRVGAELNYEKNRFLVRSEFITAKDGALKKEGWYAQVAYYVIATKLQLNLKYDTFDPNTLVSKNSTTNFVLGGTYNFNNWSKIQASFIVVKKESTTKTNNIGLIQYQISF
jgi:phosphate-selective porin OprO and OprP